MQIIPIQAVPNQAVTVTLAGQACQIDVYAKLYGLFLNLYVSNQPVVLGAPALDRNRIVRSAYLGFIGDLCFVDTQGADDPTFDGLGSRYLLAYLAPGERVPPPPRAAKVVARPSGGTPPVNVPPSDPNGGNVPPSEPGGTISVIVDGGEV